MCGIAGEIRFDGSAADVGVAARMGEHLARRGPDGVGTFAQGPLAFAHRRLKIMDLTEHAQQPMFDPQLGLGIVFNGAVYNHPELRAELKGLGYLFYSEGDTEILLKAYHHWGDDFVQHLQGMFAFALCYWGATASASSRCITRRRKTACVSPPPRPHCYPPAAWTRALTRWRYITTCISTRWYPRRTRSSRAYASCRRAR
jgi:hypothetical protein